MSSNRPYKKMLQSDSDEIETLTHKYVGDLMRINQRMFQRKINEIKDVHPSTYLLNAYDMAMAVQVQIIEEVRDFIRTAAVAIDEVQSEARETLQNE